MQRSSLTTRTGFGPRETPIVRHTRLRRGRKRLGSKPKREGSRGWYDDRLSTLEAQIVKARDGYECQQCKFDGLIQDTLLECGHIYPKSAFPAGKHNLDNMFCQCHFHNQQAIGRPEFMMNWYVETHEYEALERLHASVLGPGMTLQRMREILPEREKLLDELRCHVEAMV